MTRVWLVPGSTGGRLAANAQRAWNAEPITDLDRAMAELDAAMRVDADGVAAQSMPSFFSL